MGMARVYPSGVPEPRGVLGYDGTDFRVPSVDSAGHLQVDVQGVIIERVASLFRWGASASGTSGDLVVETSGVPAGSWLYVSWVHVLASAATYSFLGVSVGSGGVYRGIEKVLPPSTVTGYSRQLGVLLGAGETLQLKASGLTGSVSMWVSVVGYYLAV